MGFILQAADVRQVAGVLGWCRFEIAAMLIPEIVSGGSHERRQAAVCAVDGLRSLDFVRTQRGPLRRRCPRALIDLHRAVSRHGVCATDLSREPARHRSVPERAAQQALRHGLSCAGAPLYAGRCQPVARLAHLRRTGATTDGAGAQPLCQRKPRHRSRCRRLCAGLDHHRPVPEPVPLGAFPFHQVGHQGAHAARSARLHPRVYPRHQRRSA